MKNWPLFFFINCALLIGLPTAHAQSECPALVRQALETVDTLCANTARNQACYGNLELTATPQDNAVQFTFENPGDLANVADIRTLQLSGMDLSEEHWGVALMQLQANLPETLPGQNVTMLLFGDVEITNVGDNEISLAATANANARVRVRPRTDEDNVMWGLNPGQEVTVNGRLVDNSWTRIAVPVDVRGVGWVSSDFLSIDGDLNSLSVVEPGRPTYGPMQAFYFNSGIGDRPCVEAPDSGILVQTPQGVGTVSLLVNEVAIELGSTALLQAGGHSMSIAVLEGRAAVTAQGITQGVPAGSVSTIPLSDDGLAADSPSYPAPYQLETLQGLPVELLEAPVTIADPYVEQPPTATLIPPTLAFTATPFTPLPTETEEVKPTRSPTPPIIIVDPPECSINSDTPAIVSFLNPSEYTVEIYWVDYNCQEVYYNTLRPLTAYDQETFVTHAWRVRDAETGQLLVEFVTEGDMTITIN